MTTNQLSPPFFALGSGVAEAPLPLDMGVKEMPGDN
jgi:hypothetical protein